MQDAYDDHFSMFPSSSSLKLHLKHLFHKAKARFVPVRVFYDQPSRYRSANTAHEAACSFRHPVKRISGASMTTSISGTNDIHLLVATLNSPVLLIVSQLHTL